MKPIEDYKLAISNFIKQMEEIPDWYLIVQKRGNAHAMMSSMGVKVDDYEYWANAHKDEYLIKYNSGDLDINGLEHRAEKFKCIVLELEKVIQKAAELKINITNEMFNDYCAARASLLATQYTLKEIS